MKQKMWIICVCIICAGVIGCKKNDKALLEDETKKSGNAAINKEIGALRDTLKSAKDDFQKSEITGRIAELEAEKGDVFSSVKSAHESIKLYPGLAKPHYVLGKSYLVSGRYTEAEFELQTAVGIDEKLAPAYYELGNLYFTLKRFDESMENYLLAVKYEPADYQAWNNLGSVYYRKDKLTDAENCFNKVVQLKPDFSPVYKNFGILYELKMKDKKKASAAYAQYLERRPNAPDRAAVKIWIANLGN